MKKIAIAISALLCMVALAACGGNKEDTTQTVQKVGTADSPVPVGTEQEVTDMDENTYTFKVIEAYTGQEAIDKALTLDEYGLNKWQPQEGKQYVLVHYAITAKELADETFTFNSYGYLTAWANGASGSSQIVYGDGVSPASIMEGASTEGWSAYIVDQSDEAPMLKLDLDVFQNGESCWFALK